jgi:hypothetical protein
MKLTDDSLLSNPLAAREAALVAAFRERAHATLAERLQLAKRAHTTRRVAFGADVRLLTDVAPRSGDLVLARVDALGQHDKLQDPSGRRVSLFVGDEIVVAYGHRYAPSQFEALVPADLGPCHLAAGGGIAARVVAANTRMSEPTALTPLGLIADAHGAPLNLASAALAPRTLPAQRPPVFALLGASMDSGKTTAAAALIRGLSRLGLRVGAAKVTGTGASGDPFLFRDSGAREVLDFVDAGCATTYLAAHEQIEAISATLIAHLCEAGSEVIVVEVADGLLQRETRALLEASFSHRAFDGVLFAAADALGAAQGVRWLRERGHNVLAATGLMTASPLARREAEEVCDAAVRGVEQLESPLVAAELRSRVR